MFREKIKWVRFQDSLTALAAQMPEGGLRNYRIAGNNVVVAKNGNGLHAFKDRCPHQGVSFRGGKCDDEALICPFHQYRFDLQSGRGHGMNVTKYELQERSDGLYIGFPYLGFSWFGKDK